MAQPIIIPVTLDAKQFLQFSLFDTFIRRKGWRSPALFATILSAFALVCFSVWQREGAILLGTVLLVIGLGLPAFYVLNYRRSVLAQARRLGLSSPKQVYTITFTPDSISVTNGTQQATYAWSDIPCLFQRNHCFYLYVNQQQGYVIPAQEDSPQYNQMVELLSSQLSPDKVHIGKSGTCTKPG